MAIIHQLPMNWWLRLAVLLFYLEKTHAFRSFIKWELQWEIYVINVYNRIKNIMIYCIYKNINQTYLNTKHFHSNIYNIDHNWETSAPFEVFLHIWIRSFRSQPGRFSNQGYWLAMTKYGLPASHRKLQIFLCGWKQTKKIMWYME